MIRRPSKPMARPIQPRSEPWPVVLFTGVLFAITVVEVWMLAAVL